MSWLTSHLYKAKHFYCVWPWLCLWLLHPDSRNPTQQRWSIARGGSHHGNCSMSHTETQLLSSMLSGSDGNMLGMQMEPLAVSCLELLLYRI